MKKMIFLLLASLVVNSVIALPLIDQTLFEDEQEIETLLQYLMIDHQFAFTLFGSKPMTTMAFFKNPTLLDQGNELSVGFPLDVYWKKWKKYLSQFHSPQFFFLECEDGDLFEIYFFNKNECLKVIKNNLALFHKILQNQNTPEVIWESFFNTSCFVHEALNDSIVLYGILLGYGTINSYLFDQKMFKGQYFIKSEFFNKDAYSLPWKIRLPNFVIFEKGESEDLKKSYLRERKKICELYRQGSVLEVTLQGLTAQP